MKLKITLLLLCTAMTCSVSFAQTNIKLQRVAGGSADDNFSCLVVTKDGGTLAGGTSYSGISGNKTQPSRGSADYWVVKYGKTGGIQWNKTIGSSGYDQLACVQQTTDSGYILGGTSSGGVSGDKTSPSISSADYWIVKLDKNGNIQWDKSIDDTTYHNSRPSETEFSLYSLQQTSDKGYILAGIETVNSADYYAPYWVAKLDSNGNMQWSNYYGFWNFNAVIQQTPDGGYILGGNNINRDSGGGIFQLIRIDKDGNQVWEKNYVDDASFADLTSLVQVKNGYVLGGSAEEGHGPYGTNDFFLFRTDTAGNEISYKYIGGSGNETITSLDKTSDGGLIAGGYSNSDSSGDKTENSRGGYDYWIVKLNAANNIMWNKTYGGGKDDKLYTVKERKPGEYVLGGSSSSAYSGDKTAPSKGGVDYWWLEIHYTKPAPQIVKEIAPDFSVYPNPATDKINIYTKGKAAFMLFTQSGKQIASKIIENNGSFDVSHLTPGFYFITNLSTGKKQSVIVAR